MVTIEDVAKRAGVSKTTVSHALSGSRPVAAATKEKIQRAIEELNYVPSGVAQNLVSGKSNILSLIYPLEGTYLMADASSEFILSAAEAVNEHGYEFLLNTKQDPDEIARFVRRGHSDALILMDVKLSDPRVEVLKKLKFPFVLIGRCEDNTGIDYVDIDATFGVYEATKHLIHLGHTKIAFLRLMPHDFGFSARAFQGYCKALVDFGLAYNPDLVVDTPIRDGSGYDGMHRLMTKSPDCTACIVLADQVMVGVVQYCEDHDLAIPDRVSLIGFGSSLYQSLMRPPLTTIEMPAREMSRQAVEIAVDKVRRKDKTERQVLLKPHINLRQSTAPPPRI